MWPFVRSVVPSATHVQRCDFNVCSGLATLMLGVTALVLRRSLWVLCKTRGAMVVSRDVGLMGVRAGDPMGGEVVLVCDVAGVEGETICGGRKVSRCVTVPVTITC